jgi:hypothetical protein
MNIYALGIPPLNLQSKRASNHQRKSDCLLNSRFHQW